jgi:hypothetical protein
MKAKKQKAVKVKFNSEVISVRELAELADVRYYDILRRQNGVYRSELDANTKTKIANALVNDIKSFFADLGYKVSITQKVDSSRP